MDSSKKSCKSFHKGKTISKEHRQAISEKLSGGNSPRAKQVVLVDSLTNAEYSFKAITTAAKELNINYSALRSAIQNKQYMLYKRWIIKHDCQHSD